MVSKCNYLCSLDLGEHVRYPQHLMNCSRTLSKAIQSEINKISKSNFFERIHCIFALWVLQNQQYQSKKLLLKILLNYIQITLEQFLYYFVRCCGYPICFLGFKEYKANKFESMQPTKRIVDTKKRRRRTFSQLILPLHHDFNPT